MAQKFVHRESQGPKGWTVWTITGHLDRNTAEDAHAAGKEIMGRSAKTALDLSEVDYLSSAGLRVLILLDTFAKKSGREFAVTGAVGMVKSVLEDSGMDLLLNVRETTDDL